MAKLIPYFLMFGSGFMVATLFIRRFGPTTQTSDKTRRALRDVRSLLQHADTPETRKDALRRIDEALRP